MNDRRLRRLLRDAVELLDRVDAVLPERLVAMTAAMNDSLASPSLEAGGGPSKTTFCEVHERERCACGAGTPYANLSDRTGEAGVRSAMGGDRAAQHRHRIEEALASIGRQAEDVVRLVSLYGTREPTDQERQETTSSTERDVPCWSCSRSSKWEPAVRSAEVAGVRRELCWWCFDWVRKGDGSPPTREQVDQHHRGQRVRRSA